MSTTNTLAAGAALNPVAGPAPTLQAASPSVDKKIALTWKTTLAFAALLFGLGCGFAYGVITWFRPALVIRQATPPAVHQTTGAANTGGKAAVNVQPVPAATPLDAKYDLLKNGLDAAAENAKRLDRLLTFLVTIITLYALALGLNSYFGLKQILESGKDDLARLKEFITATRGSISQQLTDTTSELQEFRGTITAKYPEIGNMHENLRKLVNDIDAAFPPGRIWTLEYAELTARQREQIAGAEIRIASLEFFQLARGEFRKDIQKIYQRLGRFYSSKYLADGYECDWERASLYFEKAMDIDSEKLPVQLRVDHGVHLTAKEVRLLENNTPIPSAERESIKKLRSRAKEEFSTSRNTDKTVLGASFNLAWVIGRQISDGEPAASYDECIALYSEVIEAHNADTEYLRKYLADAYMNRAEARVARASDSDPNDPNYASASEDLEKSKEAAKRFDQLPRWKAALEKETDTGELQKFKTHAGDKLNDLLA